MSRRARTDIALDVELDDLPPELRWREWMGRVEAVIFASAQPATREILARVVGKTCKLDLLIDDIRDELRGRPYEIVAVAGGWRFRTKLGQAAAIRAANVVGEPAADLSRREALVLMTVAYVQPVTRGELGQFFGAEVSRDTIAALRRAGLIAAGPRSPQPGAPYAYVTTPGFRAVRIRILARSAGYRKTRGCRPAGPARWGCARRAFGRAERSSPAVRRVGRRPWRDRRPRRSGGRCGLKRPPWSCRLREAIDIAMSKRPIEKFA